MNKHVPSLWPTGNIHPAWSMVFQHMGASWSVTKREEVLNSISCAFFPSDKQANTWKG